MPLNPLPLGTLGGSNAWGNDIRIVLPSVLIADGNTVTVTPHLRICAGARQLASLC
jgi:hypothetical protein